MHRRRRTIARVALTLMAAVLVVSGCTDSDAPDAAPDGGDGDPVVDLPGDIELVAALRPFDSCDAFLDHVQSEALELVGPYGLDSGIAVSTLDTRTAVEESAADDAGGDGATASAPTTAAAGGDFSTTNVQEAGVDEPDIVKTDGQRIVALAGGQLHVIDATGDTPVLQGSITLGDFWASELFLVGDRVLAIGHGDMQILPADSQILPPPDQWRESMQVVAVDISDPTQPRVERTMVLTGGYVSARLVDGVARIVVREWAPALPWVYSEGDDAAAAEANREVVRNSTVDDWLPGYSIVDETGAIVSEGRLVDCERAHHPEVFGGLGTVSVVTVDVAAGLGDAPADGVAVLGAGDTVYASPTGLYVTTTSWNWLQPSNVDTAPSDEVTTQVHRFDISAPDRTTYQASGQVPGYVLNQWALDEFDGNLRIATTTAPPWQAGPDQQSESLLTVMAVDGETLVPIGQVGGLGLGEQIFAVRYFDDFATVVTFERTDPLYTIDLADPTNPTVTGELKINGYSAYLHPVGEDLLLGVGQDATDEGFTTGTQVSLFDISDRTAPTRIGQWALSGASSEVEFDARAFLWWPPSELAVVPLSIWNDRVLDDASRVAPEAPWLGAVGLDVSPDGTITEIGRLTHQGEPTQQEECWIEAIPEDQLEEYVAGYEESPDARVEVLGPVPGDATFVNVRVCSTWWDYDYEAQIRRSLVIGDRLYTLSEKGLQAADLATLAPIALVELPGVEGESGPRPIEG